MKPERKGRLWRIVIQASSLCVINNSHLISQKIFGLWSENHGVRRTILDEIAVCIAFSPFDDLSYFKSDEKRVFREIRRTV